jgi:hypothetical protein
VPGFAGELEEIIGHDDILSEAEPAWHRYGATFLANRKETWTPWALKQFGPPKGLKNAD